MVNEVSWEIQVVYFVKGFCVRVCVCEKLQYMSVNSVFALSSVYLDFVQPLKVCAI